jgi:hypothetical protein
MGAKLGGGGDNYIFRFTVVKARLPVKYEATKCLYLAVATSEWRHDSIHCCISTCSIKHAWHILMTIGASSSSCIRPSMNPFLLARACYIRVRYYIASLLACQRDERSTFRTPDRTYVFGTACIEPILHCSRSRRSAVATTDFQCQSAEGHFWQFWQTSSVYIVNINGDGMRSGYCGERLRWAMSTWDLDEGCYSLRRWTAPPLTAGGNSMCERR